ncbi:glycine cleavage system pyridoxal-binding protein P [Bradyrhizobium sp. LM6.9]
MTAHRKSNDDTAAFVRRHIGPSARDVTAMLEAVGAKSVDALMAETLPASIRQAAPLDLGKPLSETEAIAHMGELAAQNQVFASLIGPRLFRHDSACGDPAQHSGEPGLVHGLHALSAGDQPGPA